MEAAEIRLHGAAQHPRLGRAEPRFPLEKREGEQCPVTPTSLQTLSCSGQGGRAARGVLLRWRLVSVLQQEGVDVRGGGS